MAKILLFISATGFESVLDSLSDTTPKDAFHLNGVDGFLVDEDAIDTDRFDYETEATDYEGIETLMVVEDLTPTAREEAADAEAEDTRSSLIDEMETAISTMRQELSDLQDTLEKLKDL